jgi:DNA recombination protein RmuC
MEVTVALAALLVITLIALGVVLQRKPGQQPPTIVGQQPVLTAAEIREVIREVHGETLRDLADQAKNDRDDVISTATRQVGTVIDSTKKEIESTIKGVEAELDRLRQANVEKFGNFDNAVSKLSAEAAALTKVLSSAQGRGSWGERMLEDILTNSGFKRGINYEVQETLAEGGRPDYSFFLPPNRVVYLDSKFPLENYLKFCEANEDATRKIHRDAFLKNVEQRVKELEKRDYVNQSDRQALDTVLLFIPNDGVVSFIQENKPTLIDDAARKRVVFCSPLTLYMFLSMMHQAASSFYMEQNANEILRLLQKFSKSWTGYVKYLKDVAKHFDKIQTKLKAVTTGRLFGAVNKPVLEIEELARIRGIDAGSEGMAELNQAIAEIEGSDDDSEDV